MVSRETGGKAPGVECAPGPARQNVLGRRLFAAKSPIKNFSTSAGKIDSVPPNGGCSTSFASTTSARAGSFLLPPLASEGTPACDPAWWSIGPMKKSSRFGLKFCVRLPAAAFPARPLCCLNEVRQPHRTKAGQSTSGPNANQAPNAIPTNLPSRARRRARSCERRRGYRSLHIRAQGPVAESMNPADVRGAQAPVASERPSHESPFFQTPARPRNVPPASNARWPPPRRAGRREQAHLAFATRRFQARRCGPAPSGSARYDQPGQKSGPPAVVGEANHDPRPSATSTPPRPGPTMYPNQRNATENASQNASRSEERSTSPFGKKKQPGQIQPFPFPPSKRNRLLRRIGSAKYLAGRATSLPSGPALHETPPQVCRAGVPTMSCPPSSRASRQLSPQYKIETTKEEPSSSSSVPRPLDRLADKTNGLALTCDPAHLRACPLLNSRLIRPVFPFPLSFAVLRSVLVVPPVLSGRVRVGRPRRICPPARRRKVLRVEHLVATARGDHPCPAARFCRRRRCHRT